MYGLFPSLPHLLWNLKVICNLKCKITFWYLHLSPNTKIKAPIWTIWNGVRLLCIGIIVTFLEKIWHRVYDFDKKGTCTNITTSKSGYQTKIKCENFTKYVLKPHA